MRTRTWRYAGQTGCEIMILILGKTLVQASGILTGFFFFLSFLSCCCHTNYLCRIKQLDAIRRYHRDIMWITFILFLIHATFAILGGYGIYL